MPNIHSFLLFWNYKIVSASYFFSYLFLLPLVVIDDVNFNPTSTKSMLHNNWLFLLPFHDDELRHQCLLYVLYRPNIDTDQRWPAVISNLGGNTVRFATTKWKRENHEPDPVTLKYSTLIKYELPNTVSIEIQLLVNECNSKHTNLWIKTITCILIHLENRTAQNAISVL